MMSTNNPVSYPLSWTSPLSDTAKYQFHLIFTLRTWKFIEREFHTKSSATTYRLPLTYEGRGYNTDRCVRTFRLLNNIRPSATITDRRYAYQELEELLDTWERNNDSISILTRGPTYVYVYVYIYIYIHTHMRIVYRHGSSIGINRPASRRVNLTIQKALPKCRQAKTQIRCGYDCPQPPGHRGPARVFLKRSKQLSDFY